MTSPTSVRWNHENLGDSGLTVQSQDWRLEFNMSGASSFECRRLAAMWNDQGQDTVSAPCWELTEHARTLLKRLAEDIAPPYIHTWETALQQAEPPEQIKKPEQGYR